MEETAAVSSPTQEWMRFDLNELSRGAIDVILELLLDEEVKTSVPTHFLGARARLRVREGEVGHVPVAGLGRVEERRRVDVAQEHQQRAQRRAAGSTAAPDTRR
ncbi:MAG: hypothetical protein KJ067_17820 [Vicinamibacteria bacterium]|nr:hypothetical protein [Vicinamibacteria bacterium]